jgi:uncharacterized protein YqjF (DUF2071 family)
MRLLSSPPLHSPPSIRPIFLTAHWRYLVMLSYEVPPAVLEPLVPSGTTLDFWSGKTFVSVVGFRFLRTRVAGIPVPFHRNFDEVNLRFYVQRVEPAGETRRGVAFIREVVPRAAIAWLAKRIYNEPYVACPMRSSAPIDLVEAPGRIGYQWRTSAGWQEVAATAVQLPKVPSPDSLTAFIAEHYWGYTRQRSGRTIEYAVEHPQWRVWEAQSPELTAGARPFYGPVFDDILSRPPCSSFIAEGSPVRVRRPRLLPC